MESQVLEQVKRLVFRHLSGYPVYVYLFGSWASGKQRRSSDIDIAVEFATEGHEARKVLADMRTALEESTIPYKVDVVHVNSADDVIVRKVREEGILWADPQKE